jgi:hypothetical protein
LADRGDDWLGGVIQRHAIAGRRDIDGSQLERFHTERRRQLPEARASRRCRFDGAQNLAAVALQREAARPTAPILAEISSIPSKQRVRLRATARILADRLGSGKPDMRVRRNLAVLGQDRTLKDAGRCDQQLVGWIAMEGWRQLGGFHHDSRV